MPVDPHTILLPPPTLQIRRNILPPLHPLTQPKHPPILPPLPHLLHRHRKRKADPIHALPKHQIRIRQLSPIEPLPAAARFTPQHTLEVAEELGKPIGYIVGGFPLRLLLLILVIRARGHRVVRVVRFVAQPVQRRQRELVHVVHRVPVPVPGSRQAQLRAEVEEDVGRLAEQEGAVPEGRRGQRRRVRGVAVVGAGDEGP